MIATAALLRWTSTQQAEGRWERNRKGEGGWPLVVREFLGDASNSFSLEAASGLMVMSAFGIEEWYDAATVVRCLVVPRFEMIRSQSRPGDFLFSLHELLRIWESNVCESYGMG
jgi:hypothetical protein